MLLLWCWDVDGILLVCWSYFGTSCGYSQSLCVRTLFMFILSFALRERPQEQDFRSYVDASWIYLCTFCRYVARCWRCWWYSVVVLIIFWYILWAFAEPLRPLSLYFHSFICNKRAAAGAIFFSRILMLIEWISVFLLLCCWDLDGILVVCWWSFDSILWVFAEPLRPLSLYSHFLCVKIAVSGAIFPLVVWC